MTKQDLLMIYFLENDYRSYYCDHPAFQTPSWQDEAQKHVTNMLIDVGRHGTTTVLDTIGMIVDDYFPEIRPLIESSGINVPAA